MKSNETAKQGQWVEVDYIGSFDNKEVFDKSQGRGPLKFKLSSGMVIPGFDKAIIGLKVGESKDVKISAKDAYGEKNNQKTELPKDIFQDLSLLQKGKEIELMSNQGPILLDVIEIKEDSVIATLNHPMAGKNLNFNITLRKIYSEEESKKIEEEMGGNHCSNDDCTSCECDDKKESKKHKQHKN